MGHILTLFTEDVLAVIGFILFAAVVYNLIGIVLRRLYGVGRQRSWLDRRLAEGKKTILGTLFPGKKQNQSSSRKDFSRNVPSGNDPAGNNFRDQDPLNL